jgi:hypothetical protein
MTPTNDRAAMNQHRANRNATLGKSGLGFRYRGLHEIVHHDSFRFVINPATWHRLRPDCQ